MAMNADRDFLYEANPVCGMIYLTVDNNSPIFIGFHQSIKVQIKLDQNKQPPIERKTESHHHAVENGLEDSNLLSFDEFVEGKQKCEIASKPLLIEKVLLPSPEIFHVQTARKSSTSTHISHARKRHHKSKQKPEAQKKIVKKDVQNKIKKKAIVRNSRSRAKKIPGNNIDVNQKLLSRKKIVLKPDQTNSLSSPRDSCEEELESHLRDKSNEYENKVEVAMQKPEIPKEKSERSFQCEYCYRRFKSRQDFFSHRRSKTISHNCSICGKVFSFRAYLLVHKLEHKILKNANDKQKVNLSVCDICGLDSKSSAKLKKHMFFHTKEYYYKCCVCDRKISGFGAMNNHMISHKNAGMIKCNCCEQFFASRADLSRHQLALLEIKCSLCGEVFPNRTSRTVHYKLAHQDNILKCDVCSHMFSSEQELASHMVYHTKYKKKQCPTCGKFVSRLEKHILTHKAITEVDESELFICDKCPVRFLLKSSLQRHQRTHSQERPFKCYQCPKSFACCSVLFKHIKTHSSIMPYECEVCGKRCKEKSNLKVHMRIHSDTKAFPCTVCSLAFSYKSSLDGHMRSKHSLETASVECRVGQSEVECRVGQSEAEYSIANSRAFRVGTNYAPRARTASEFPLVSVNGKEYTQVSGNAKDFTGFQHCHSTADYNIITVPEL